MKTKYLAFVLVLLVSNAFGQTKPINNNYTIKVSPYLFDKKKTDKITVYSLNSIGKTAWENHLNSDKINLSPKNFNWFSDMQNIESYKKRVLNFRQQDNLGRDMPIDVHSEVIQKSYIRSLSDQ
jgi:hypothetical protein